MRLKCLWPVVRRGLFVRIFFWNLNTGLHGVVPEIPERLFFAKSYTHAKPSK